MTRRENREPTVFGGGVLILLLFLVGGCDDTPTSPRPRDAVPPFSVSLSAEDGEMAVWILDDSGRPCAGYSIDGSSGTREPGVLSIRLEGTVSPPTGLCPSQIFPAAFRAAVGLRERRMNLVISYGGEFDVYDIEVTQEVLRLIGEPGHFSFPTAREFPRE